MPFEEAKNIVQCVGGVGMLTSQPSETPLQAAINRLDKAVSTLETAVAKIDGRTKPARSDRPKDANKEQGITNAYGGEVVQAIHIRIDAIANLTRKLNDISDELDI